MKLDLDTLPTVPDAPPEAGPDRALEPALPEPGPPAAVLPGTTWAADAEGAGATPIASPIAGSINAVAAIHRHFLFDSHRRTLARRACLAMVTETERSGEDAGEGDGAALELVELAATDRLAVARATG